MDFIFDLMKKNEKNERDNWIKYCSHDEKIKLKY